MGTVQEICSQVPSHPTNNQSHPFRESVIISLVDNMPNIKGKLNFEKPSTFKKIQDGAALFCEKNQINENYIPLISRLIAYKQDDLFHALKKLKPNKKNYFLDELLDIDLELMDSLYNHFVVKDNKLNSSSFVERLNYEPVQMQYLLKTSAEVRNKMMKKGLELLHENKVGMVVMCAGYSRNFEFEDKFLIPLAVQGHKCLLEVLLQRLKNNLSKAFASNMKTPIIIACNISNRQAIQSFLSENDFFQFDKKYVKLITTPNLPLIDEFGKFCITSDSKILLRSEGTAKCLEGLFHSNIMGFLQYKGIQYVHVIGAENLAENPADPFLIGLIANQKVSICATCTESQSAYEDMPRYVKSQRGFHLLSRQQIMDRSQPKLLTTTSIAMNSMVFKVEALSKISSSFDQELYMAKRYHPYQTIENYYDFENERAINLKKCIGFQKDIRDYVACSEETLFLQLPRSKYVPLLSKNSLENDMRCWQKWKDEKL